MSVVEKGDQVRKSLAEIAKVVGGEVIGDGDFVITNVSGIKEAREGDLTFVANSKYFNLVEKTKASAIITPRDLDVRDKMVIKADNPSLAFAKAVSLFVEDSPLSYDGIHPTAIIADDAILGPNVQIGPYAVIEKMARIGDKTIIGSGCFIGHHTKIGGDCLIYPNVSIREKTSIGNRVIVHCGTVIGSDGFGFVNVNDVHEKIPQIGTVEIQDDVEIGACVTIDRARFDKTLVGRGTKIDNLVQIAHNVRIGENCIIVAQVGISGSSTIEKNVILAGQAGLAGHLTIGEGAIVASQAGVINSVPPRTMVSGYPAKPHTQAKRVNACVQRLPLYVKTINELKERVRQLEEKLDKLK